MIPRVGPREAKHPMLGTPSVLCGDPCRGIENDSAACDRFATTCSGGLHLAETDLPWAGARVAIGPWSRRAKGLSA